MPETIVIHRGRGLPYSKGLMAQSLSATGLTPGAGLGARAADRAAARRRTAIERSTSSELRSADRGGARAGGGRGRRSSATATGSGSTGSTARSCVLLGGTTGVGKSTLATMAAHRLGVTRVIATDVIRQVLRASFSRDFMPSVHSSAFEVDMGATPSRRRPSAPGSRRSSSARATRARRSSSRACTSCPACCTRSCASAASWSRRSSSSRTGPAPRPLRGARRPAAGRALPGALRSDPPPPGSPLGA